MSHRHLEWKSDYVLGIEDIDFQHHFFLNLINRLSKEFEATDDLVYRAALLSELNAYVRFHFISEENMMRRADYPDFEAHRRHHRELIDILSYKENLLEINLSEKESEDIINFLVDWFFCHTACEDKLFADFLREKEISVPVP